jgi:hypothetical protein
LPLHDTAFGTTNHEPFTLPLPNGRVTHGA